MSRFHNKWTVCWCNTRHPNGKGRQFTRYGDAIKFARKQETKPTTNYVDIAWHSGEFTFQNRATKERYTFSADGHQICELPEWLLE